ncbi:CD225/dispanin family protein [Sinomicrobium kalidii]|uniref:CD225/dispanin family protein n=1 Tax=Sinomicrobium kalidii TaxID=2900738 RepID=UPI001E36FB29|nr:CD225/dispanin family protein [Sinomicrobium kalidii]UGU16967.1 CD225/dispanin family protein [Sinomicrobium kalidii]
MPDNHLALAIVSTLLCCMPLGIVSIVYASRVKAYMNGNYNEARRASKNAKIWALVSIGSVFGITVLLFLFYLLQTMLALAFFAVFESGGYG